MSTNIEKDFILLKSLLCFLKVAERQQIKETATEIHMKQSNLSNIIIGLEKDLKAKLFNREARGVSLTRSGANLFEIACNLTKTINEIQNFASTTHKTSGDLRLWTSEGLGGSYISSCLPDFYEKFPEVHLSIISSLKDPRSLSEFDVGIMYHTPQFDNATILFHGSLKFRLYASKGYLVRYGYPANIDEIKQSHKLCIRNDFETLWPKWSHLFKETKNISVNTDSSNLLLSLVEGGLGISFLPEYVAQKHETLVPLLGPDLIIEHPFWIICPSHLTKVPKVRALMEHIKEITEKL